MKVSLYSLTSLYKTIQIFKHIVLVPISDFECFIAGFIVTEYMTLCEHKKFIDTFHTFHQSLHLLHFSSTGRLVSFSNNTYLLISVDKTLL